jgi:hypothetical protein
LNEARGHYACRDPDSTLERARVDDVHRLIGQTPNAPSHTASSPRAASSVRSSAWRSDVRG